MQTALEVEENQSPKVETKQKAAQGEDFKSLAYWLWDAEHVSQVVAGNGLQKGGVDKWKVRMQILIYAACACPGTVGPVGCLKNLLIN